MNLTRKTKTLERQFEEAIQKAVAAETAVEIAKRGYSQFLLDCPRCTMARSLRVIRVTGMDGRRYDGWWDLEPDGFAWGADRNGDGSTENEIVQCVGCDLIRPLHEFILPQ